MLALPGLSRSSALLSIFNRPANLSTFSPIARPRLTPTAQMRLFSCSNSHLAKKPNVPPFPLLTVTRPTPPGPSTRPPASKSATILPNSAMPGSSSSSSGAQAAKNVNAHRPLGSFRYRPQVDVVSGTFGPLQSGSISVHQAQIAAYKAQIAEGLNRLIAESRMAVHDRVLLFCEIFEKGWWRQSAVESVKLLIRQGVGRKMSEVRGHSSKLLLHRGHLCINDGTVSTAATELYGILLKHAEVGTMMLDIEREHLLGYLVNVARSGHHSFPAIDLAIKAFTLLPAGSFNRAAFKQLKTALNLKDVNQVPNYFGRQPSAM